MIRYALQCDGEHDFEAWFSNAAAYDDQAARGLVECPFCGSKGVRKAIMAPAVAGTKKTAPSETPPQLQSMMMEAMAKVREHVEAEFDYVGDAFAREARDIHEGRSEQRDIYGEATPGEVKKLKEDGVPVSALPPKPVDKAKAN